VNVVTAVSNAVSLIGDTTLTGISD